MATKIFNSLACVSVLVWKENLCFTITAALLKYSDFKCAHFHLSLCHFSPCKTAFNSFLLSTVPVSWSPVSYRVFPHWQWIPVSLWVVLSCKAVSRLHLARQALQARSSRWRGIEVALPSHSFLWFPHTSVATSGNVFLLRPIIMRFFQKSLQLDVCTDTKVSFMHILQAKELVLRICWWHLNAPL